MGFRECPESDITRKDGVLELTSSEDVVLGKYNHLIFDLQVTSQDMTSQK